MSTITVLADNDVVEAIPKGLRGEWGFAAAVDGVVWDTGQTGVVPDNAARLGIDFDFETVVLSHGHFDHTGGLRETLARLDEPEVYCHPDVWETRYLDVEGELLDVGMPFTRERIADLANIIEHTDPVEVSDGIYALGEIPREHEEATVGVVETEDGLVEDDIPDDQALAVETDDGVALVLGCGHSGLQNTIEYAEEVVGDDVRYVIGGSHLVDFDDETTHRVADQLEGQLELFAGTHCTGKDAKQIFQERFPDAFETIGVGSILEV